MKRAWGYYVGQDWFVGLGSALDAAGERAEANLAAAMARGESCTSVVLTRCAVDVVRAEDGTFAATVRPS